VNDESAFAAANQTNIQGSRRHNEISFFAFCLTDFQQRKGWKCTEEEEFRFVGSVSRISVFA
jgi:hypothetical protein